MLILSFPYKPIRNPFLLIPLPENALYLFILKYFCWKIMTMLWFLRLWRWLLKMVISSSFRWKPTKTAITQRPQNKAILSYLFLFNLPFVWNVADNHISSPRLFFTQDTGNLKSKFALPPPLKTILNYNLLWKLMFLQNYYQYRQSSWNNIGSCSING